MRFIYSTREKFPAVRVDLTELFSQGIARQGFEIDWHMQSSAASGWRTVRLSSSERLIRGASVTGTSGSARLINGALGWLHDLRLVLLIPRGGYAFAQVRDKIFASLVALVGCRLAGIPFYYWMSFPYADADLFKSTDSSLGLSSFRRLLLSISGAVSSWMLYEVILPNSSHVFVQSERMKKDLSLKGIEESMMTPVPMAISWNRVRGASVLPSTDPALKGRAALIYVGTLVRARRLDFLLDVLSKVRVSRPDALLIMVGDAPMDDMRFLMDYAERLGLKNDVVFTGYLPMMEAWAYILAGAVCLSPFRPSPMLDSTTPTKIVEYLALGRPVVANDHPDQSHVLRESGAGITVDYDANAFSEAIILLLSDPERAESMAEAGPEYVRTHRTYEGLVPQLAQLYRCFAARGRSDIREGQES